MNSKKTELALNVAAIVEPICKAQGLELVQTKWTGQGGTSVLRITIDRIPSSTEGSEPRGSGVTLADCQAVSRAVSVALDVHEDLMPGRYQLEVSSPGLERPLVRPKDYLRFSGRRAKIKTHAPIEGRHAFTGIIRGLQSGRDDPRDASREQSKPLGAESAVEIEVDGQGVVIPLSEIAKAHLVVSFG